MWTPMVALTLTPATALSITANSTGAENSDVEVFAQTLHELLDSDTESAGGGIPMSLHPLLASSALQAGADGEGETTALPLLATPARAGGEQTAIREVVEPNQRQLPLTPSAGAVANTLGEATSPVAGGERENSSGELTALMPLAARAARDAAALKAEPLFPNGEGGVSPVLSARQDETPSTPLQFPDAVNEFPVSVRETRSVAAEPSEQPTERALPSLHNATALQSVSHTAQAQTADASQRAEPNWHTIEQVAQHIERMVYERERDAITVRLDPPELGAIELRIQTTGNEVQAWVNAERDQTRQLLQQAQQQLREQLESRGLQLTHFDVGGQSNPHYAQARTFRTPAVPSRANTYTATATDSLDGRWSVWV